MPVFEALGKLTHNEVERSGLSNIERLGALDQLGEWLHMPPLMVAAFPPGTPLPPEMDGLCSEAREARLRTLKVAPGTLDGSADVRAMRTFSRTP